MAIVKLWPARARDVTVRGIPVCVRHLRGSGVLWCALRFFRPFRRTRKKGAHLTCVGGEEWIQFFRAFEAIGFSCLLGGTWRASGTCVEVDGCNPRRIDRGHVVCLAVYGRVRNTPRPCRNTGQATCLHKSKQLPEVFRRKLTMQDTYVYRSTLKYEVSFRKQVGIPENSTTHAAAMLRPHSVTSFSSAHF